MQDPEQIRRFTRGVAMMRDPPWLPIAAWFAAVPMLGRFGVIPAAWVWGSLIIAMVATAVASRRFKRTYGVVRPSRITAPLGMGAGGVLGLVVVALGLQVWVAANRIPVEPFWLAFGAWAAWGGRTSNGIRPQLYVLAAICVALAFLPLVNDLTVQLPLRRIGASLYSSAFGAGWAYVCLQDYRAIRRSLRNAQG